MPYPYIPSQSIGLRTAGYDEAWLQKLVLSNPAILGLGDLKNAGREVRQSSGGRLDFLLMDPELERMYEVELLLGSTDESHIIRTVEYWDIESRRWPSWEHRAVIVAEEITNRFFNVIWLLNRSIPIIAIKLNALIIDGKMTLCFTKVLDIFETPEGRDPVQPQAATRQEWVDYSAPESIAVFDKCIELMSQNGRAPRVTYNAGHIAVGGLKKNCAWFYPRRKKVHCKVEFLVPEDKAAALLQELNDVGIDASQPSPNVIKVMLSSRELEANKPLVQEVLALAAAEGGGL
ncbi:MAG TPA: hypothetical protein VNK82_01980 [Terriglobales bacterium]|nr:hypothetical protein [Terriglobales bacterium]